MPVTATESALWSALRQLWNAQNCPATITGGVFLEVAPAGSVRPYAVFVLVSSRRSGQSNKSRYWRYQVQLTVHHKDLDQALAAHDTVKNLLEEREDELTVYLPGSAEGSVCVFQHLNNHQGADDQTGLGWAGSTYLLERSVPRTRP